MIPNIGDDMDNIGYYDFGRNFGWTCPGCNRCYAPSVTQCGFCPAVVCPSITTTQPCPPLSPNQCEGKPFTTTATVWLNEACSSCGTPRSTYPAPERCTVPHHHYMISYTK